MFGFAKKGASNNDRRDDILESIRAKIRTSEGYEQNEYSQPQVDYSDDSEIVEIDESSNIESSINFQQDQLAAEQPDNSYDFSIQEDDILAEVDDAESDINQYSESYLEEDDIEEEYDTLDENGDFDEDYSQEQTTSYNDLETSNAEFEEGGTYNPQFSPSTNDEVQDNDNSDDFSVQFIDEPQEFTNKTDYYTQPVPSNEEFDEDSQAQNNEFEMQYQDNDIAMPLNPQNEYAATAYPSEYDDFQEAQSPTPAQTQPQDYYNESIISNTTSQIVRNTIQKVSDIKNSLHRDIETEMRQVNMYDLVVSILTPELQRWLNTNLPAIVNQVVEKEIKKLVDQ